MTIIHNAIELRLTKGFWYVATPYTNYADGIEAAYHDAREVDAMLDWARVPRFTPIVSAHENAMATGIDPKDHDFWMGVDFPFMERAHGLIVAMLDGWEASRGVTMERLYFVGQERPIYFLDPHNFDYVSG